MTAPGRESPGMSQEAQATAARAETVSEALGGRIRSERHRAGLTVRGLASRTGVSPSLISQIERGRATPSVATLWSIATELGISIADLFSETEAGTKARTPADPVQAHETRKSIVLAEGVRWERLTSTPDAEVDFVYVVYPPGAASCPEDALNRHEGREFGYVISGTLGVKIGFEEHVVRANDSISFDSMIPHRLWAIGDEPVRAIWTVINRRGDPRSNRLK